MMNCEKVRDNLDLYAAGALPPEARAAIEEHLLACPDCLPQARTNAEAINLLALTFPLRTPPPELRARVLEAVEPARGAGRAWSWRSLAVAATVAVILGALGWQTVLLRQLGEDMRATRTALTLQEHLVGLVADPATRVVPLQPSPRVSYARGVVVILGGADRRPAQIVVVVAGLPPARPDGLYQAWLQDGEDRISAGAFRVDVQGAAVVRFQPGRDPSSYQGLGITYEHGGPVPAPKGPRVMLARFSAPSP